MNTRSASIDLTDVDVFARRDHHQVFERLRAQDDLHWNASAEGGFWALTRYEEVAAAYRDHLTFSSAGGAMLGGSFRNQTDTATERMLVASDPPRHRLLRQQMHPLFSAEVVRAVSTKIRSLLVAAFGRLSADGGGDFAQDIALELPVGALMTLVDIGYTDAHQLVQLTRRMIGYRDPAYSQGAETQAALLGAQIEIFDFFEDLLDARQGNAGNDLVSYLLRAEINGRRLSHEEVLYNCMNVVVGGDETSSYSACTGLEALMNHPEQYESLLARDRAPESLIDEVLRWSSTNAYVKRVALRSSTIRGATIAPGDVVTLWNVSANRDESQFAAAGTFRSDRSPNRHLSYGHGVHRCIGAATGTAELRLVFDLLAQWKLQLEPAAQPTYLRSNFILGTVTLPVKVAASSPPL